MCCDSDQHMYFGSLRGSALFTHTVNGPSRVCCQAAKPGEDSLKAFFDLLKGERI